jgi:NADH-quinone oxidoreductase subunit C
MTTEGTSGFREAEDEGPGTGQGGAVPVQLEGTALAHPSVVAARDRFGDAILRHEVVAGDEHVIFVRGEDSFDILEWMKNDPDHAYNYLSDVTAVDYGSGRPLQVVYQLFSIPFRRALRIKVELPESALEIESVAALWASANWLEREVFDMFGIVFRNHPDLRRILMPDNYAEGHPLRKDFPLRGRFSRAEQTRRALSQDPEDAYIPAQFGGGRAPQVVAWRETGGEAVPLAQRDPDVDPPTPENS